MFVFLVQVATINKNRRVLLPNSSRTTGINHKMAFNNENLVIIKEESIPNHFSEEPYEEKPTDPLLFRLKEESIDHAYDQNSWGSISSVVDIKSEPKLNCGIENSEPAYLTNDPSEIKSTTPVKIEPEIQTFDDRPNEIDSCRESAANAYSCQICDYTSAHIGNFNRHVKHHDPKTKLSKTPKDRLYDCGLCGYKCSEFIRLKRHMMTHTGEKPLACDLCNFRTSHSNDFQRHMMVHTGEKPHSCDLCDYRSSDVRNLKRHIRTHTGEKPYACDSCGYKSRTSHHMNRHKKMKHKVSMKTSAT